MDGVPGSREASAAGSVDIQEELQREGTDRQRDRPGAEHLAVVCVRLDALRRSGGDNVRAPQRRDLVHAKAVVLPESGQCLLERLSRPVPGTTGDAQGEPRRPRIARIRPCGRIPT